MNTTKRTHGITIRKAYERWWLVAIAILVLPGFTQSKHEEASMPATTHINASKWQALEKKHVVFGHQSVGYNLLNGLTRLADRDGVKIGIHEQRTASDEPGISHFVIGSNGDPLSKIQDFAGAVDAGAAQGADIALMKLCYIDFNAATDARQLANDYIVSLESLALRHPATRFVAVTAPLMAAQTGPKAWVKQLIGKQPNGYLDNARRAEFNTLLRERYLAAGRLFDLARIEAESNRDTGCKVQVGGQEVEALCPELTGDGGHLNERGQELLADAFLSFIAALPNKQAAK